jgi:hypothetical protein
MARLRIVSGLLGVSMGIGGMTPAIVRWLGAGAIDRAGCWVIAVALSLVVCGIAGIVSGFRVRDAESAALPSAVRAAIVCNVLFLAFCALEASDGLLRQGGRIMYWTTALFAPALVLLYGQVLAQRWAWWVARAVAAIAAVWFLGFIVLIPFANLQSAGQPVPWQGRLYMTAVSLVFASIAIHAFRSLGRTDARKHFGLTQAHTRSAPVGGDPLAGGGGSRLRG